jgi:CDP-diacylglycerol--glycerol-3-phosphate 3-phosphatidyltransferase
MLWTVANGITITRLVVTTTMMLVAIVSRSPTLLLVGLLTSWLLDVVDGLLARGRLRETVIGAQLDILADRMTAMWVVLGVVVFDHAAPLTVVAAAAVWLQLSFFDQLLASQFLRFGHWSPDEFHLEDPGVWRLNWAPAAKIAGNLPLALLMVGGWCLWIALGLAILLIVIRMFSYLRIARRIEQLEPSETEERSVGNVHPLPEAPVYRPVSDVSAG